MMKKLLLLITLALIIQLPAIAADYGEGQIHGFLSQGYLKTNKNNYFIPDSVHGSSAFIETGFNYMSKLDDKLTVGLQMFGRDLGEEGNQRFILDWAVGDYRFSDSFGVRLGKVKIPSGLYNKLLDMDMLVTPVFLPSSIYQLEMREILNATMGGEIYGYLPGVLGGSLEYELYMGTTDHDENMLWINATYDALAASLPAGWNINIVDRLPVCRYNRGASVMWDTPLTGLRLGASYFSAKYMSDATVLASGPLGVMTFNLDMTTNIDWMTCYSAEYTVKDMVIAGEYARYYNPQKTAHDLPALPGISPSPIFSDHLYEGGYMSISNRLSEKMEAGCYYSVKLWNIPSYKQKGVVATFLSQTNWNKDLALFVRYNFTENWLVKAQIDFMDGTAGGMTLRHNPDGYSRFWNMVSLKTTYNF